MVFARQPFLKPIFYINENIESSKETTEKLTFKISFKIFVSHAKLSYSLHLQIILIK